MGREVPGTTDGSFEMGREVPGTTDGSFEMGAGTTGLIWNGAGGAVRLMAHLVPGTTDGSFEMGREVPGTTDGSFEMGREVPGTTDGSFEMGREVPGTTDGSFEMGREVPGTTDGSFETGHEVPVTTDGSFETGREVPVIIWDQTGRTWCDGRFGWTRRPSRTYSEQFFYSNIVINVRYLIRGGGVVDSFPSLPMPWNRNRLRSPNHHHCLHSIDHFRLKLDLILHSNLSYLSNYSPELHFLAAVHFNRHHLEMVHLTRFHLWQNQWCQRHLDFSLYFLKTSYLA